MYEKFIRDRISELRLKKGVSEYKMSTDMGHSKSYIQSITSGRSLPSLGEFLFMCEYFEITPKEFFDDEIKEPMLVQKAMDGIKNMDEKDLNILITLIDRLNEKEQ
ncbi:helix-turn-helix domain-containing protein [Ructibacterium gallinarum]|uniref:Helix-turn-helix transcriptional regulator n=1 Tax=Ructibacterium gallinarum TaxID=2779355 RepID=A0A9D5M347_9FIRM|nr:helix-turn-helix transcriptional regulator [Ructibacterium gallinarum]MBE5039794.1 helix-turn-helix transcriptional regulator [Ructibacterium gallinarum]